MNVVLISTYELGRQPFGLASPAAWLERAGAPVECLDLSRESLREDAIRAADLIAFYVPMHTATRLAVRLIPRVRALNPSAHLCFYGLYAPVNEAYLRSLGAGTILGGEFEAALLSLVQRLCHRAGATSSSGANGSGAGPQTEPLISLDRLSFLVPDRSALPPLGEYARLITSGGEHLKAGYTEASRGCKHLCRHCPIVPVYQGRFRIVQSDVVLEDIRRQAAAGARHITFGDPDFFNGVGHAEAIVRRLHETFPDLTYDVTVKIEHLLRHAKLLPLLRDTGCLFITSAVESVDDGVLALLDKGHTRRDFIEALRLCREASVHLSPTFVPFTPWTTPESYRELLAVLGQLDLIASVAPIQLAIRLLIPAGSRLLELPEIQALVGDFDPEALAFPWRNPDARVDALCSGIQKLIRRADARRASRFEIFEGIRNLAHGSEFSDAGPPGEKSLPPAEMAVPRLPDMADRLNRAAIPYINEPWYC